VLRVLGTVARVAFGFVLACIAAGLVTMMFVNTPADVLAQPVSRLPQTASDTFELALLTATHIAIFAIAFVLITAGVGEWFSIRSLTYYLITGTAIAMLGFVAQYASEVTGQPTILNNYAVKAFLTTGFFAGFVYWLAAGQFAGKAPEDGEFIPKSASSGQMSEPFSEEGKADEAGAVAGDDEASVIIGNRSAPDERHSFLASLLIRLKSASLGRSPSEPAEDAPPSTGPEPGEATAATSSSDEPENITEDEPELAEEDRPRNA
jgi:hypothetical protein